MSKEEGGVPANMYPMEMISYCHLHGMNNIGIGIDCRDMFYPTLTDYGK